MKHLGIILLSLTGLRPTRYLTANAADAPPEPTVEERLAKLETENAALKEQLTLPRVLDPAPSDGSLAMLCRGADVDIADVRWRMQAGLDAEQAVEAALAQKKRDEEAEKAPAKKGSVKKA